MSANITASDPTKRQARERFRDAINQIAHNRPPISNDEGAICSANLDSSFLLRFIKVIDELETADLKYVCIPTSATPSATHQGNLSRARHPALYLIQSLKDNTHRSGKRETLDRHEGDKTRRTLSNANLTANPQLCQIRKTNPLNAAIEDTSSVFRHNNHCDDSCGECLVEAKCRVNDVIHAMSALFDRGVRLFSDEEPTCCSPDCVDPISGHTLLHTLVFGHEEDQAIACSPMKPCRTAVSFIALSVLRWLLSHICPTPPETAPPPAFFETSFLIETNGNNEYPLSRGLLQEEAERRTLEAFLFGLVPARGSGSRVAPMMLDVTPIQWAALKGDFHSLELLLWTMVDFLVTNESAWCKDEIGVPLSVRRTLTLRHAATLAVINNYNLLHLCAESGNVESCRYILSAAMGIIGVEKIGNSTLVGLRGLGFTSEIPDPRDIHDIHRLHSLAAPLTSDRICGACATPLRSIDRISNVFAARTHAPGCSRSRGGKGSPFHIACARGHHNIVEFFLSEIRARNTHNISDDPILCQPDSTHMSTLLADRKSQRLQTSLGDKVIKDLILEKDAFGRTALHCAAEVVRPPFVQNERYEDQRQNCAHPSWQFRRLKVIKTILKEAPEAENALDQGGRNALELALLESSRGVSLPNQQRASAASALFLIQHSQMEKQNADSKVKNDNLKHRAISVSHLRPEEQRDEHPAHVK